MRRSRQDSETVDDDLHSIGTSASFLFLPLPVITSNRKSLLESAQIYAHNFIMLTGKDIGPFVTVRSHQWPSSLANDLHTTSLILMRRIRIKCECSSLSFLLQQFARARRENRHIRRGQKLRDNVTLKFLEDSSSNTLALDT